MESVQKFALVDPRILKSLQGNTPSQTTPVENALTTLDRKMKDIINEPGTMEDKVKLYNQALQRYQFYKDTLVNKPLKFTVTEELRGKTVAGEVEETKKNVVESRVIDSMPKTFKYKAKRVIDIIKESPEIDFNSTGELSVKGEVVKGSNIEDLIHNAVRRRGSTSTTPIGWTDFQSALEKANAPKSLLGYTNTRPAPGQRPVGSKPPPVQNRRFAKQWVNL